MKCILNIPLFPEIVSVNSLRPSNVYELPHNINKITSGFICIFIELLKILYPTDDPKSFQLDVYYTPTLNRNPHNLSMQSW